MRSENLKMKYLRAIFVIFCAALTTPAVAETLSIVGTGDGMMLLRDIARTFEENHPGNRVKVPDSIGSSGGIKAVGTDKNKLGRVARSIKDKEKPYGLTRVPYARSPVAFFTHPDTGVPGLSSNQVLGIFAGDITNWSDVGGSDGKIRVVIREESDSSRKALKKTFPGWADIHLTSRSKMATTTQEAMDVVAKKKRTIGFGPYPDAVSAGLNILKIDGKSPVDAGYPSFTTLSLIYKEENKKGLVATFVDFILSGKADETILKARGVPIR